MMNVTLPQGPDTIKKKATVPWVKYQAIKLTKGTRTQGGWLNMSYNPRQPFKLIKKKKCAKCERASCKVDNNWTMKSTGAPCWLSVYAASVFARDLDFFLRCVRRPGGNAKWERVCGTYMCPGGE